MGTVVVLSLMRSLEGLNDNNVYKIYIKVSNVAQSKVLDTYKSSLT